MRKTMIDLLQQARVFEDLNTQEIAEVAKISHKVTFKNGERILEAETPARYLFIVGEGLVELRFKVTLLGGTVEITIDQKFNGTSFGWSALTEPYRYTLSALAMRDTELIRIKANDIKRLCEQNNHLGFVVMKNIALIIGERFGTIQNALIAEIQQNLKIKE
ncbi:MAG: Crp/Fnr family transcriptional regulator [bacterium]